MTKRPTDLSLSTSPTLVQPAFLLPEAAACETQEMLSLMEDRGGRPGSTRLAALFAEVRGDAGQAAHQDLCAAEAPCHGPAFEKLWRPWYVINPDTSLVARVWQGVVAASLLWVAIVTPVQVGLIVELGFDLGTALGRSKSRSAFVKRRFEAFSTWLKVF